MSTIKGIFEPFARYVKKQLRIRKTIMAARESHTSRPDLFFTYTTAKTCTIRMASGVNLRPPGYDEEVNPMLDPEDEKWGHGAGMAEKYILEGGVKTKAKVYNEFSEGQAEQEADDPNAFNAAHEAQAKKAANDPNNYVNENEGKKARMVYNPKTKQWDIKDSKLGNTVYDSEGNVVGAMESNDLPEVDILTKSSWEMVSRYGIDTQAGAYGDKQLRANWDGDFGIVPMPGITDATIRTKSDDGSLREAQVNFECHNRRQLEILEALYMRPGYPILLEWGWNPYISNSGTIESQDDVLKDFFLEGSSLQTLNSSISRKRENSGGNYDGFIGYCKNFEFKAREDGGYDCTTEIIAHGEILESLKARQITIPAKINSKGEAEGTKVEDAFSLLLKSVRATLNKEGDAKYANIKGTGLENQSMWDSWDNFSSEILWAGDGSMGTTSANQQGKTVDGKNLDDVKKLNSIDDIYVNAFKMVVDVIQKVMKLTVPEIQKELKNDAKTQTRGHDYLLFGTILKETIQTKDNDDYEGETGIKKSVYLRWDLLCQLINFTIADGYKTNHESLTELTYLNPNQKTYSWNDDKDAKGVTKGRIELPKSIIPFYLDYSNPSNVADNVEMEELNNLLGQSFDPNVCLMPHQDMFKNALFQKSTSWTPEAQVALDKKEEEIVKKAEAAIFNREYAYSNHVAGLSETSTAPVQNINIEQYQIIEEDLPLDGGNVDITDLLEDAVDDVNGDNDDDQLDDKDFYSTDLEGVDRGDRRGNPNQVAQDMAENFQDMTSFKNVEFSENSIGMVYFNLEHLIATYNKMAFEEYELGDEKRTRVREKFGIFEFIEQIWKDCSRACGDFYDFRIHTEHHRPHVARIIDFTVEGHVEPESIFKFDPQGLGSISRDFNFSSKISSDIASVISVAAQAPNNKDSLEALSFKAFHKNIKSRFTDDVYDPEGRNQIQVNAIIELQKDLKAFKRMLGQLKLYQKWSNNQYRVKVKDADDKSRNNINSEKAIALAKELEKLANKLNQKVPLEDKDGNLNDGKEGRPFAGTWAKKSTHKRNAIIPLEFDIQLDGISGIVPLQLFQINPDKLPLGYQRPDIAFIVKGETQKITAGQDWITEINGQLTLLNTDPPEGKNPIPDKINEEVKIEDDNETKANDLDKKDDKKDEEPPKDEDAAVVVNTEKVGGSSWKETPLYKKNKMQLRSVKTYDNGIIQKINDGTIVEVGDSMVNPNKYAGNMTSTKLLKGKYYLHKDAAPSFKNFMDELDKEGVNYVISSAIRFGSNTGGGSHGAGLAIDFSNLYQLVGGSVKSGPNEKARIEQPSYKQIAEIGKKHGWYNPWRLSDLQGKQEEIWHFEYWGTV